MKRVQVLMSTYNGENYLAEQIESILSQAHVKVSLLVRDDGSADHTPAILTSYAGEHVQIDIGKNIGTQKSFLHLIECADSNNDYFAFADQDDVWHPQKLQKAVEALEYETAKSRRMHCCMRAMYGMPHMICLSEKSKIESSEKSRRLEMHLLKTSVWAVRRYLTAVCLPLCEDIFRIQV